MSELKETKKLKLLQYMSRPQNILNLIPTLKTAYFLVPKRAKKNDPRIRENKKQELKET